VNEKLKIRISNDAFDFINKLLDFHDEYDCIALKEPKSSGCCKNSKVDIILDNTINYAICEDVEGLNISYNKELSHNFTEIVIVLKKDSLYLKATPISTNKTKGCSGCISKSNKCTSCSGCSLKEK
jgi:hypothetical protein